MELEMQDLTQGRSSSRESSRAPLRSSLATEVTAQRPSRGASQRASRSASPSRVVRMRDGRSNRSLFQDPQQMKDDLRDRIIRQGYNVKRLYHRHGICQRIVRSLCFERVQLVLILLNTAWIGIDTELNGDIEDPVRQPMDVFFCILFLLEALVRFGAFEEKRNCLKDSWFVFDFVLVSFMILELLLHDMVFFGAHSAVIRLFKIARVARFVRFGQMFPELFVLMKGMMVAMRVVTFTLILLFIIAYMFGIVFRVCALGGDMSETGFSSLPESMQTLLLRGTLLDGVATTFQTLVRAAIDRGSWHLPLIFAFYIFVSALTVLNLLIGVVCEAVSTVAAVHREEWTLTSVTETLQDLLEPELSPEGTMSKETFLHLLQCSDELLDCLQTIDVDVEGMMDVIDSFFEVAHPRLDGSPGREHSDSSWTFSAQQTTLEFGDIVKMVLQLRGSNKVTVKDLIETRRCLLKSMGSFSETLFMKVRNDLRRPFRWEPAAVLQGASTASGPSVPVSSGSVPSFPHPQLTRASSSSSSVSSMANSDFGDALRAACSRAEQALLAAQQATLELATLQENEAISRPKAVAFSHSSPLPSALRASRSERFSPERRGAREEGKAQGRRLTVAFETSGAADASWGSTEEV